MVYLWYLTHAGMVLISAIQPGDLTSDYEMGLPWLISFVATYAGMGLRVSNLAK
jgi:hypothetical protein